MGVNSPWLANSPWLVSYVVNDDNRCWWWVRVIYIMIKSSAQFSGPEIFGLVTHHFSTYYFQRIYISFGKMKMIHDEHIWKKTELSNFTLLWHISDIPCGSVYDIYIYLYIYIYVYNIYILTFYYLTFWQSLWHSGSLGSRRISLAGD